MDYMTAKEAAVKWNVSDRQVQRLLSEGRIVGAQKFGVSWMIPLDSEKPQDPRGRQNSRGGASAFLLLTATDLPKNDPAHAFAALEEPLRALASADLAYRSGDAQPAVALFRELPQGDSRALSAASLATAAAISTGDYALYHEIERFLQTLAAETDDPREQALLSLPGTLAAVSMAVPDLTPDWLADCDFSLFDASMRPFLLYLYALSLRNVGAYAAELAVAQTTLTLCEKAGTFTWLSVYLGVLCASAALSLGDEARAKRYLDEALSLAMPYGMIAPFADHLGALGGLVEAALERQYPAFLKPTVELWSASFKNWMGFHNTYARERITTVLSPQEYHVAKLLVSGATIAEAARRLHLSPGRVKNIASAIYGKLHIDGRQRLNAFIL